MELCQLDFPSFPLHYSFKCCGSFCSFGRGISEAGILLPITQVRSALCLNIFVHTLQQLCNLFRDSVPDSAQFSVASAAVFRSSRPGDRTQSHHKSPHPPTESSIYTDCHSD